MIPPRRPFLKQLEAWIACTAKTAKPFGKLKGSKPEADVAQLVEQPIRNRQVTSSTLVVGSILFRSLQSSSPLPTVQLLYH
jgi:hypothetical protein